MDAHDFLITLFDHLSIAFVDELFVGSMKCTLRCTNPNCHYESIKEESLTSLTLRFSSESNCHLCDCLKMYNEEESLEITEFAQCSRCGFNTASERKLSVTSWSKVLVVHLSRFCRLQQVQTDAQIEHKRLDTPISFPLIGLNVGSETDTILYDCVAVCNHFGSCTGGHYTAHALRGSKWFCFDDAKKPVEIKSPQEYIGENNSSAYMLFYERRPFLTVHSASGVASI